MNERRIERLRRRMVARQARERGAETEVAMGIINWLLVAAAVVTMLLGLLAIWRKF